MGPDLSLFPVPVLTASPSLLALPKACLFPTLMSVPKWTQWGTHLLFPLHSLCKKLQWAPDLLLLS